MNKRATGSVYETVACDYLKKAGYSIRERNFRCRQGEIDIVAQEGRYLVFVEVKYRKTMAQGEPSSAVDYHKQKMISRVAAFYLVRYGLSESTPCRFDVVAVTPQEIELIRNAFDFQR